MPSATDITLLRDRFATLIEAITPTLETAITFREGRYNANLDDPDYSAGLSPDETTRTFHVLPRPIASLSRIRRGETQLELEQAVDVWILYQVPLRDDGVKRLANLTAVDFASIVLAITATPSPTTWGAEAVIRTAALPSSATVTPTNAETATHIMKLRAGIHYAHT